MGRIHQVTKIFCEVHTVFKAYGLPTELIWHILGFAEFILSTLSQQPGSSKLAAARMVGPHTHVCAWTQASSTTRLSTLFERATSNPKFKTFFRDRITRPRMDSENSRGTYETSSWLEVSILRSMDENNTRLPGPPFVNVWISNPSDFQQGVSERGWYLVKRPPEAEQGPQGGEGDFAWYLQGNQVALPQPVDGYTG